MCAIRKSRKRLPDLTRFAISLTSFGGTLGACWKTSQSSGHHSSSVCSGVGSVAHWCCRCFDRGNQKEPTGVPCRRPSGASPEEAPSPRHSAAPEAWAGDLHRPTRLTRRDTAPLRRSGPRSRRPRPWSDDTSGRNRALFATRVGAVSVQCLRLRRDVAGRQVAAYSRFSSKVWVSSGVDDRRE